jgi:hypothetical protein
MLLQEILDQIDIFVPNALPNDIKIKFINQVQRQLFRDYPATESIYRFITTEEDQLYPLPDDCPEDRIVRVVINEDDQDFIPIAEEGLYSDDAEFWTISSGQLLINPLRDAGLVGYVYYKPRPTELSEDNLEEEPTFPEDFHELLVYGAAKRVSYALPKPDMAKAQAMDTEYSRLAEKADLVLRKKMDTVRIVRSWS